MTDGTNYVVTSPLFAQPMFLSPRTTGRSHYNILKRIKRRNKRAPAALADAGEDTDPLVVSEINDAEKMSLVSQFQGSKSDWVVGNQLVGMAIAQLAHSYQTRFILDELLTADGNDIYLKDFRNYGEPEVPISFFEIWLRARKRPSREIAIGYMISGQRPVINPPNKYDKMNFAVVDKIIVISED